MPGLQNSKQTLDFLGTIGTTDRGDGVPLNATAKALVDLGGFVIEEATHNLERKGNIASGETASSMEIVNVDLNSPKMSLEVVIASTYIYLDQGVKGYSGAGQGKFAFKTKYVSKKMALAILRWLKRRSLSGKIKYKGVSRNERKNKRINKAVTGAKSRESLAYAVAASIKKKGIKRTLFFTNAVKAAEKRGIDTIGEGFKIDVINSLNDL